MNAGDTFYNSSVLSKIFEGNNYYGVDILYGVTIVKCKLGFYPKKACDRISIITKKMPFCHQSAFVRSEIYKRFKFDISFLIKADFYFFIKCYLNNLKFQHLESYVTICEGKGISSTHPIKSRKEAFRPVIKNNLPFKIKLYHFSKILEAFGKEIFKKILKIFLPDNKYELLMYKYRLNRQKNRRQKNENRPHNWHYRSRWKLFS